MRSFTNDVLLTTTHLLCSPIALVLIICCGWLYLDIVVLGIEQAFPGVAKITDGYNPATWMLEVTNADVEAQLDVDFADLYLKSSLYQ